MLEVLNDFFELLYSEGQHFSILEIVGVVTAIFYVILATKGNKWCFVFGLISSSIYVYLTLVLKLYFDFGINLYYVVMSFYGWFAWSNKQKGDSIAIITMSNNSFLGIGIVGIIISFILAWAATQFSDAALPYLDSFTTIFSIVATYLVVKKYIENWLIWVVVDLVSTGMYFYKELYLTSLLFLIYTLIALFGFLKWKKLLNTT